MASVRGHRRSILAVAVGLGCIGAGVLGLAHPGSARTRVGSHPASDGGCVTEAAVTTSPQCLRTGHQMPPRRSPFRLSPPGSVVGSSALFGDRVFLNADEGVALANGDNAQYPVLSTDGGRVWRIDGPPLHVDAADGAEGVGSVGITAPRTFFAYGSSVVDVTTDGGPTWWETFLGELVVAVVPGPRNELVAYVQQQLDNNSINPAATWQYVSRDGGRYWSYTTALGALSREGGDSVRAASGLSTRSCRSARDMIQNHVMATPTVSCSQARRLMHELLGGSKACYPHGYTANPRCKLERSPVLKLEGFQCSATHNPSTNVSKGRCVKGRKLITATAGP